jgi:hypothetical protein
MGQVHLTARCEACRQMGLPVVMAGAGAAVLALGAQSLHLLDRPLMAGCGLGMSQAAMAMALRMAAVMTVIGLVTARPRLLRSWAGVRTLALWLGGLTLFTFADQQAAISALGTQSAAAALLLQSAPLLAGLLAAAWAPRGEKSCVAAMVIMAHAGLMSWPWMAACAGLTAWQEARHAGFARVRRHGSTSGLNSAQPTTLSV